MIIGIVGAEQAKFTPHGEAQARRWIRQLCGRAARVVSGHSPLGGIDWWAIEEAKALGVDWHEYPAKNPRWEPDGYKARNLQIADASDLVVCITVARLPDDYRGMRFPRGCYHCGAPPEHHIKSGGCWTMRRAAEMGKQGQLLVVRE